MPSQKIKKKNRSVRVHGKLGNRKSKASVTQKDELEHVGGWFGLAALTLKRGSVISTCYET